MDPIQQVMDATFASRDTARRLLRENGNDVKSAITAFRRPKGRVAGFGDRNKSDREDKVFTGGEKSGLAVQNRGGPKPSANRGVVDDIIEKAMNHEQPAELPEEDSFSRATGFRLGQSGENFSAPISRAPRLEHVSRTLTFWSNGFSVDDGPLHSFDDPMTQDYLDKINSGSAPIDLLGIEHGQLVDLKLEDRNGEEYKVKPKPQTLSNMSGGNRLGAEDQAPSASEPAAAASTAPALSSSNPATSSTAAPNLGSGDALVQLRLADGSSRRVRVESNGLVQQLYDLIPETTRQYVLQTPMPPTVLDTSKTIQEAGLKNAVVVQRWT